MDYESLIKLRVCEPLAMLDTTINLTDDQRERLSVGHSGGKPVPNWDLPTLAGAGALRSTLRDMLRFLHANIQPSSTPLQKTIEFTHQIQTQRQYRFYKDFGCMGSLVVASLAGLFSWQSFGLPVWGRVAIVLAVPAILLYFWPMGINTMTLGWHVDDMVGDKPALWHNGGTGGYASYMAFVPQKRQGVVVLANSDKEPDSIGRRILEVLQPKSA
jgi:CubicO group peptidase (beta-lactamase class C family)